MDAIYVDASNHDHITAYLRVLADDYVRRQITDIDYIALLKDVRASEPIKGAKRKVSGVILSDSKFYDQEICDFFQLPPNAKSLTAARYFK